jgi:hypothetical protein
MEMTIHVGEREGRHVLALVFLFERDPRVVFGRIRLKDVEALEFLLHFSFNFAQTLESGLIAGFVNHFNVLLVG